MANGLDPDQTPHFAAPDLGLHCLLRPVWPSTKEKYGEPNEPGNEIMHIRTCASSEDSDHPAHRYSPISLRWAFLWIAKDSKIPQAIGKMFGQTAQISRLI